MRFPLLRPVNPKGQDHAGLDRTKKLPNCKRKIEKISSSTSSDDVFEYMGKGQTVPKDVARVRFHPSVVDIDSEAFRNCKHLREVMLNEGLREFAAQGLTNIEGRAFYGCSTLQSINIPSTVTKIGQYMLR